MFISEPWNVRGGNLDEMISQAKAMGITGVLIKFADGDLISPAGVPDANSQRFMEEFKRITPFFKQAGFKVGGWIYQYLTSVTGEIDACSQAIAAGADWIVLNAEADAKGKKSEVKLFGEMIRDKHPNVTIGFSSFAIASFHQTVPFDEYAAFVDVIMPQMFWNDIGWTVSKTFRDSITSYAKYGKPIAPTGQAYAGATTKDMARFVELCKEVGFKGISWWSWQHATAAQVNAVQANLLLPTPELDVTATKEVIEALLTMQKFSSQTAQEAQLYTANVLRKAINIPVSGELQRPSSDGAEKVIAQLQGLWQIAKNVEQQQTCHFAVNMLRDKVGIPTA